MATKHTPGQLKVAALTSNLDRLIIDNAGNAVDASYGVEDDGTTEAAEANKQRDAYAAMFATAPAMLIALQRWAALDEMPSNAVGIRIAELKAREARNAAIAKAMAS